MTPLETVCFYLGAAGLLLALFLGVMYFADRVLTYILQWKKVYWGFIQMICFPRQWESWLKRCNEIYDDKQKALAQEIKYPEASPPDKSTEEGNHDKIRTYYPDGEVNVVKIVQEALRAHELEVVERCALKAYAPKTIYYSNIDVLETEECLTVRRQIAESIRAIPSEDAPQNKLSNALEKQAQELVEALTSRPRVLGPLGIPLEGEPLSDDQERLDLAIRVLKKVREEALKEAKRE